MVVDQKLLNSKLMKYNIWANVINKLTWQQAQTPVQQTTPIIQQQPVQQQTDTYKVITNKFPTYDIKDLMWFWPQAVKNQLWFANSMSHYNKLQAQADANTDPNVRYNLTKPELTNKQTLQIEQVTPETNEQWLKINKTASFKDLVADLQNVANQWRNLEFVKFRDLYPEYVENWDKVVDLFESIKANPQYSAEQVTTTAQKAYPELFGINENYSDSDKMTALKKLYDEMVSNKQNWIQLTQQDIIDRYPEYANTEDINTVMELQDLINKNKKSTPTFIDIYENFDSLIKWNAEIWNTEKSTMKKDIDKINNMSQSTYEHLSEEWKKYVQYLATAKEIADYIKEQYYTKASDVEIVENLKNKDPELYNEIFGDLDIQANLSEEDRKLLDEWYTIWAGKSRWTETKHSATEKLAWLGRKLQSWAGTEWKWERNPQPVNWQREDGTYERNPLMREDGTLETDPIKIREIKMAGNNYQQRVRMQEYRWKNPWMDKIDYKIWEFLFWLWEEIQNVWEKGMEKIESSQERKDIAELNKTKFWDALKKWDVKTMLSKSTAALWQSTIDMWLWALTWDPLVAFGSMYAWSYERAMQDIESDENLKWMTQEEKERTARLMAGVESVIEEASMSVMMPWVFGWEWALSKLLPWFNNALLKWIAQTELWAASEWWEEVLQELFNNLITRSYWSNRELWNLQDYWDIFNETFLSSQLMSAIWWTKEWVNQAQINQIQNEIKKQWELRNTVLEWQALISENFNDFAQRVEEVPWTTTEELQQVWNNAQQKKQDLEQKANNITSNSYSNVNVPTYERTTVKENEQPKLSAKESQEYTDLLDEMEKNWEITKEDRKKVEMSLWVFTRNTEKTEQPQTEWLAEVAETPKTEKKTWWWTRKMSWLDNETITRIENNPYISSYWNNAVNMVEKEWLSMDNWKIIEQPMQELWEELLKRIEKAEKDLWEDGRMYRLIKNIDQIYDLSDSRKWIEWVLKNYDITTNEDWKLDFSNSQFIKAEDTNAISRAVELLNNTDLTNITPKQYWNLRKKLSSLSWFDKWTSKDWEAVVRQLRHLVDQLAKDSIPWLKKVDEIFSKELKYLEEIKQWLVYQQWERKWQIKDNFYSILKTINNQNRQQMNQRLEKIMPDLSDKVEAINMLPKLLKAYAVKSRLIEVWARNIWKVGWVVTGWIPWLVVWYVFDEITGKVSKNLRKNAINKIVNSMSDTAKQRLEDIAAKQEEKETLTQEERETLNQVKTEIEKIIEQQNNDTKTQSTSETEKKSEKKTDKAEQVQAKKKNNQNTKPKTKWLAKINETKEETKTEWLANTNKQEIRLWNESDYTKDEVFYDQDWDVDWKISKWDKSITYNVDGNTNNTYIDWRSISNFIWKEEWLLWLVAKLEESMKERWLNNLYVEIDMSDYYPDWNVLSEYDEDWVKLEKDKEPEDRAIIENDPRWKSFVNEMEELWFELQDDNIWYKKFYKDTEWSFLILDEHAGEQPLFNMEKYQEEWAKDSYYRGQANKLDQKQMDRDTIATMENEDMETDFRETAKNQVEAEKQGLAEISVKVENGKVVKESETVETPQEFEVLPADVSVYDESKTTWPKRISPDRWWWWQQLTPKEAIDKKIEQITKDRQRRTEQYDKKLDILNWYIEKFWDSISQNDRSKEATEARKTIRNEIINPYRLWNFFTAWALWQIKEVFERWKSQQNAEITDKNREDINRDYIQHVKEDISHWYRYPEAVLSYNPEFRTAVDNRARYEKWLYTSFSTDDTRIIDYKKDQIWAWMKRQDGKELTQEQKDEIANWVINYQETMWIDVKRLAENNNWVYVHLNGKNPFLMWSQWGIAWLYRWSVDEKWRSTASISVWGTESYQIREDGKLVTKKKKTTMAHELTHALDALSSRKLLSESAYNDLRLKFNDYDSRWLHHSSYWTSKSEITARMVEEYVAVQNWDTEIFNEKWYWDQETYNNVIEPEINKIKNNFFQEYKEWIWWDSIEQIKADAIKRWLADISNF